jgi:hypothetical protein
MHKCVDCEMGTFGPYIKICKKTGEQIETYSKQYERIKAVLMDDRNFVEPDGSKM